MYLSFFSFMVSFYCKFTESFDVILVNCDDVYGLQGICGITIFGRTVIKNKDFYYVYVTK